MLISYVFISIWIPATIEHILDVINGFQYRHMSSGPLTNYKRQLKLINSFIKACLCDIKDEINKIRWNLQNRDRLQRRHFTYQFEPYTSVNAGL